MPRLPTFILTLFEFQVAIIVLDTQGLFDHYTTFEVNTKIFALSTALSSVQIYNVMRTIEENDLQLLKVGWWS